MYAELGPAQPAPRTYGREQARGRLFPRILCRDAPAPVNFGNKGR
jgi:hypothetical protein